MLTPFCNCTCDVLIVLTWAVELWLSGSLWLYYRSLLALLELVTAGLLYIFQYLTVEFLFGVLHLENLGGRENLFELLQILFLQFCNLDIYVRYGFKVLCCLFLGLGLAVVKREVSYLAVQIAFFLLQLIVNRKEGIGLIFSQIGFLCKELFLLTPILGCRELSAAVWSLLLTETVTLPDLALLVAPASLALLLVLTESRGDCNYCYQKEKKLFHRSVCINQSII